ncbi:hypothetical protein BKA61DRAFT_680823 [Leptodontidium sp. MPI-SDFR-AT-0119]|nr:hypothetical protein BKA61DRAFT_680823 [Leptodontidium sp. MPI-SDFR-AT-0119]
MVTGMLMVGFRHVIGTIWPVYDSVCVSVAAGFYSSLPNDPVNGNNVCRAIHKSIQAMRQKDYESTSAPNIALRLKNSKARREIVGENLSQNQGPGVTADEVPELKTDDPFVEAAKSKTNLKNLIAEKSVKVKIVTKRLTYTVGKEHKDQGGTDDIGVVTELNPEIDGVVRVLPFPSEEWVYYIKPALWAPYLHCGT